MVNETVMEGVTVTREAVFIGDFEFEFQGNLVKQYIKMKDASSGKLEEYEKKVKEMMIKHYAFYGQFQKENEYVTRESILWCSGGSKMAAFDILNDHGVEKAGSPIGICTDCKANENLYTFGDCKKPTPEGYPERPVVIPTVKSRFPFIMHKCIPMLSGSWSKTKNSKIKIWDESAGKYVDAITTGDLLTCFYGGIIEVIEVPAVNGIKGLSNHRVTLEHLDAFGFYIGVNDNERASGITALNNVLEKYEIKTDKAIAYFLGQVAKESRNGARTLEGYEGKSPEAYFNTKYDLVHAQRTGSGNLGGNDGEHFRGAGYIQLTGRANYENFSAKVGDSRILTSGYRVVGGVYNRDPNTIKYSDVGVIDVGEYAWEVAGWFWRYGNPNRKNLSTYAEADDWLTISEAINKRDSATFSERNKNINRFYNILTGNILGLPE